jgi:hypothetical protein
MAYSSIFVMHGSAIAGLAFKASTSGSTALPGNYIVVVVRLVLALASGFPGMVGSAWALHSETWATIDAIRRTAWPSTAKHIRGIKATRWMAIPVEWDQ